MGQEEIDNCYAVENDKKALDCLKDIVRAAEGECRPRLVLFTQGNCTPCAEEKARHKAALAEGVIQELSIDTKEGLAIAVKNEIDFFPSLVLMDCEDKIIYPSESV